MKRSGLWVLLLLVLVLWGGWMVLDCLEEQWLTKDLKIFVTSGEEFEEEAASQTQKTGFVITPRDVMDAGGMVLLLLGAGLLLTTVLIHH